MNLYERYFGNPDADRAEREEQLANERAMLAEFFRTGYAERFMAWLDAQVKQHEPSPGDSNAVNYLLGIRHGLVLVQDHLRSEREKIRDE